jgi:serine/threonine protein phosphatase PrpC
MNRASGSEAPVVVDGRRLVSATQVEEARRGRGEDRISSVRRGDRTIFVIADGAGGVSGGASAASALCVSLEASDGDAVDWGSWLTQCDRVMAASPTSGLAAAVVISVSDDGTVSGASVGDCEAWVFGQGDPVELTAHQARKPLLGDGDAMPTRFATRLSKGTLVVASDGLWKYVKHTTVAEKAIMRPMRQAVAALIDGVRLRNGSLQDDVAVMICQVTGGE